MGQCSSVWPFLNCALTVHAIESKRAVNRGQHGTLPIPKTARRISLWSLMRTGVRVFRQPVNPTCCGLFCNLLVTTGGDLFQSPFIMPAKKGLQNIRNPVPRTVDLACVEPLQKTGMSRFGDRCDAIRPLSRNPKSRTDGALSLFRTRVLELFLPAGV
jgi:hypothetical protein